MGVRLAIHKKICSREEFRRLLAAAGLLLLVAAAAGRVRATESTDWLPVSMNAGETYVISDIKPGTRPSFHVEQNPNAFLTYDTPPGKLTILSAEAGRWTVTVTNSADREVTYDIHAFAVARPGAPLTPGKAPASVSEPGLAARPGAGEPPSPTSAPMPELVTIPSYHPSSPPASTYSATVPAKAPSSYDEASWNVPPQPGMEAKAYEPGQSMAPVAATATRYRNNPSVLDSGPGYSSDSVSGGKHYLPAEVVPLMVGTSAVIDFQHRITRISVADSKIADVQVIDPFQLNLIGHQPGFTTLAIWDADGRYEERTVRIDASGRQQVMLNTVVAELDRTALENQGVNLSVALTKIGISLVGLPGAAPRRTPQALT